MRFAALLVLFALPVYATDKPSAPPSQDQRQDQAQQQHQSTATTVTTGGGQGGGASNQLAIGGDSVRSLGLANGAPIPAVCPPGLVPGKRGKRGLLAGGLVALSAVCVPPTPEEAAAMREATDLERARLLIDAGRPELAVQLLYPEETPTVNDVCGDRVDRVVKECAK